MALQGKASDDGISHEPTVSEIHKMDRKSVDRRRSVKWLPISVANTSEHESASVEVSPASPLRQEI